MQITRISPQKNNKDRFNVEVDNKFAFSISANDLLKEKIASGDSVSKEKLARLKHLSSFSLLIEKSINYISFRPRSENEMKTYLHKKLNDKNLTDITRKEKSEMSSEVIVYLKGRNYINDDEFSKWLIRQRINSRKPKSKKAIYLELQQKGIPKEIINSNLENLDEYQESESIKLIIEKKYPILIKKYGNTKESKQRMINYLFSKGFSWDAISTAIDTKSYQS